MGTLQKLLSHDTLYLDIILKNSFLWGGFMEKQVSGITINYQFFSSDSDTLVVFLHGWGQNISMMEPVEKFYRSFFNTLILDLPGFGKSEEPKRVWTVYDYADFIHDFVSSFSISKLIFVGHSFGGKISLVYASKYQLEKLVCFGSPYCKELTKLPFKNRVYKQMKKIPFLKIFTKMMQSYVGSMDYRNASEKMRGVLVSTVNTEIIEDVKKIKCPTLLVWGSLDTAVPISRAYELEQMIPDSGVVEFEGATHYAYLERIHEVIRVLDSFFGCRR